MDPLFPAAAVRATDMSMSLLCSGPVTVEKDPAGHDEQTASDARFAPGQHVVLQTHPSLFDEGVTSY
jgi:hypothetical protein